MFIEVKLRDRDHTAFVNVDNISYIQDDCIWMIGQQCIKVDADKKVLMDIIKAKYYVAEFKHDCEGI